MTKSDISKHNICIASIKRHTIKPYDFKWTNFYESNSEFYYSGLLSELSDDELVVCSVVIDADNYSILTTRRLVTTQNGETRSGKITGAAYKTFGDFKGYESNLYTLAEIVLQNGSHLNYFTETGKASMLMIYGVKTLMELGG